MILLSDDDNATGSIADLPSHEDALKGLIQVDLFTFPNKVCLF